MFKLKEHMAIWITLRLYFRDRENNCESELVNVFSNKAPRSQFLVDIYKPASVFQDN